MSQAGTIFKKLVSLEQEVQKMKVLAYFSLPKKERPVSSFYPEEVVLRAAKKTRNLIWRRTYAKKIKGVS